MKVFLKPIIAVLVFILMELLVGGIIGMIGNLLFHPGEGGKAAIIALSIIISGVLTVFVLNKMNMIKWRVANPKTISWRKAPLAIVGALMGIIAANLLNEKLDLPNLIEAEMGALCHTFWGVLAITIIGPIVEELVFREGIIGYLIRRGQHRWVAIIFSSLMFGIIHLNPAQVPFAFIMGIVLGVVYVKSHSIVLTSIIHILNNTIAVVEIIILGERANDLSYAELLGGSGIAWVYIIICTGLCVLFLLEFWKQYHRKHVVSTDDDHHHHHHHHHHHQSVVEQATEVAQTEAETIVKQDD
jgi:membrane protease YdiL (CAAX protease family)